MSSHNRFDDILGADKPEAEPMPTTHAQPKIEKRSQPKPKGKTPADAWGDIVPEEKEPSIRLNLDIPVRVNDKLAAKARQMRKTKADLIRRLLEWAIAEDD